MSKAYEKEQWRSLNLEAYHKFKSDMSAGGTLAMGVQMGLVRIENTPLENAFANFITSDSRIAEVKRRAGILTTRNEPVLITGESGTGKELIAKILHGNRTGKFVAVNATAIVETLFESELFGHVKGAFTGSIADKPGKIELANDGTLFIDEVGDMPPSMQSKILRVIQENSFERVGGTQTIAANCRFVFATHCDLNTMVTEKHFRLDLFHRINVFQLHLTPLRERPADVLRLAKAFGVEEKKLAEFMSQAKDSAFNGNVRELQAMILRFNLFGNVN